MKPLAERMRPTTLDGYIGQEALLGKNGALTKVIAAGRIPSMILWGPPGVGKTTLANIIAESSGRTFYQLSAVNSGVKDVRAAIANAENTNLFQAKAPILFIDEIHRFSKSQQDALLGAVEKGIVTLIGATTENPSFEVISALLSRCQVYVLSDLSSDHLKEMISKALQEDEYLKTRSIIIEEYEALLRFSSGDGRKLYNLLELIVDSFDDDEDIVINNEAVLQRLQVNLLQYDKNGEQHYDLVSAFIKSVRGSDPNAAVYYLARMIDGGEDPKFICRRMIILASEDIGLANPNALLLATGCFQAVHQIGMPEGRIIMSQCAVYLASSPKSNASYAAINKAMAAVKETGALSVPLKLRNAPTDLMKDLNYGKAYKYAHDGEDSFVMEEYLPDELAGNAFYEPGANGAEGKLKAYLNGLWQGKYGY